MKKFIIFFTVAIIPYLSIAQKAKVNTQSGESDCAVCEKRDSKGNCQEWDFSKCKPDVVIAKYKKYKYITTKYKESNNQNKILFTNQDKKTLNPDWAYSVILDTSSIVLINEKKKLYARIDCGCCKITVDFPRLYCSSWWCPGCKDPVITPTYRFPTKGLTKQ